MRGDGGVVTRRVSEPVDAQERVLAADPAAALARRHGVEMPITLAVDQVLNHGAGVAEAVARLLAHPYHYDRITVPSKETPGA